MKTRDKAFCIANPVSSSRYLSWDIKLDAKASFMAYTLGCPLLIELFDIFMQRQFRLGNDSGANVMNSLGVKVVKAILLSNPEFH